LAPFLIATEIRKEPRHATTEVVILACDTECFSMARFEQGGASFAALPLQLKLQTAIGRRLRETTV
jgi:hypothetical protein